jgi:DNA invertase Pin-like site-specific DNA recombinase
MNGTFVAYYRVSTDRQGKSGLGLEAQRKAVADYLNGGNWSVIADFTEVESGRKHHRPELERALAACRKHRCKLVIAKLDRLSRNLAFIAAMMDSGIEFVAVDNPHANRLTLHILAAVAQHEREMIAARTKAALQASKARGQQLGLNGKENLAPALRTAANERARLYEPAFAELMGRGMSARAMARELGVMKIAPPNGRVWYAATVLRVLRRLDAFRHAV